MIRRFPAVATAALLVACGGESGPNGIEVGSIVVSPNPVSLAQQASVQLQVAAFDADGLLLAGMPVTFTSGEVELVTVNSGGLVHSLGPAGSTTINVTAGAESVTVPVTVGAIGNTIAVLPDPATMPQLGTLQLDAALLDLVGTEISGAPFTYTTTNSLIITTNISGLISSVGPAGQASIIITSGEVSTQKLVTVTQTPTSITVYPSPVVLGRNGQIQLGVQVLDAIDAPIAGAAVSFTAEPANLISISTTGVLSAQGTSGTGSVTATHGALEVTVPVTVSDAATLTGTIARTVMATGMPYGVAIGFGGAYYGVGLTGQFQVGTHGVAGLTEHAVSGSVMTGVAVHPTNGLVYATGHGTDGLMEIDPGSGAVLRRWTAPDQMYDLAISPDGMRIFVAGSPSQVYEISTATMQMTKSFATEASVVHLLHHPSQPLIYASGAGIVREINTATDAHRTFSHPAAQATALAIAGHRLYIGGEVGKLAAVDLATGVVMTVDVLCGIYDLVAAPDGQRLLATCSGTGIAVLFDSETFAVVASIATGGSPRRAAVKPDGTGAVIANEGGWYTHIE